MRRMNTCKLAVTCFIDALHLEQLLPRCVKHIVKRFVYYRTSGEQRQSE